MMNVIWSVIGIVSMGCVAVGCFALGEHKGRLRSGTSAERIGELKEELRHERGRREAMAENAGAHFGEIQRLRRRLQLVEGIMSRSVWLENRRLNFELTKVGAARLCADLESMLQSTQVIRLCWDLSAERALALIEELRRFPNDARDADGVDK